MKSSITQGGCNADIASGSTKAVFTSCTISLVYIEGLLYYARDLYLVAECIQVDVTRSIYRLDDDVRKTTLNAITLATAER